MTPKEKAIDLIDSFELSFAGIISNDEDWEALAKQCALIAVDFAKDSKYSFMPMYGGWVSGQQYYEEVKQEINKYKN